MEKLIVIKCYESGAMKEDESHLINSNQFIYLEKDGSHPNKYMVHFPIPIYGFVYMYCYLTTSELKILGLNK